MNSATSVRLAIEGGIPVRTVPFPRWPFFEEDEINAASEVLRSGRINYWTGTECEKFEQEFAAFIGCKYAISLSNGTVALEVALYSLGVGAGDEVIVPSRTFIATASAVVARGATPVVADIDPVTQNLTAETVEPLLTPRTRGIIPVHLAGWPCDLDSLMQLAQSKGLFVLEDCAQAHGARYKGRMVGSIGDAAAFSFCQDKIITTGGEGGMFTTNRADLWERAWSFKDHGKNHSRTRSGSSGYGFRPVHDQFGTNGRMTEMQAAIGRLAVKKLPRYLRQRAENAGMLISLLNDCPGLVIHQPPDDVEHAYYKFYAFVQPGLLRAGWTRDRILEAINREGVPCFSGSSAEIYLEKAFEGLHPAGRILPTARRLGETSLMLLVHPTLSGADMEDAAAAIRKVMVNATAR